MLKNILIASYVVCWGSAALAVDPHKNAQIPDMKTGRTLVMETNKEYRNRFYAMPVAQQRMIKHQFYASFLPQEITHLCSLEAIEEVGFNPQESDLLRSQNYLKLASIIHANELGTSTVQEPNTNKFAAYAILIFSLEHLNKGQQDVPDILHAEYHLFAGKTARKAARLLFESGAGTGLEVIKLLNQAERSLEEAERAHPQLPNPWETHELLKQLELELDTLIQGLDGPQLAYMAVGEAARIATASPEDLEYAQEQTVKEMRKSAAEEIMKLHDFPAAVVDNALARFEESKREVLDKALVPLSLEQKRHIIRNQNVLVNFGRALKLNYPLTLGTHFTHNQLHFMRGLLQSWIGSDALSDDTRLAALSRSHLAYLSNITKERKMCAELRAAL